MTSVLLYNRRLFVFPCHDVDQKYSVLLSILTQEELDGVALVLNAPKGYIFNSTNDTDNRTINAEVRVQGKTIDNKSQKLAYYWFVQDCTITSNNLFYCKNN